MLSWVDKFCSTRATEEERAEILDNISKEIKEGRLGLTKAVESLGEYLVSTNEDTRAKATRLLSQGIVANIPPSVLNEQAAFNLVGFYADRMHDFVCLQELLPGCTHMITSPTFAPYMKDDCVINIMTQLFSEVHVQALTQGTRRLVYELLEAIAVRFPHLCGVEYISGLIQCVDGERDPRNLLKVFQMVTYIANIKNANTITAIDDLSEELFDVVSCYYPISFTPPPGDVHKITPEQLSEALRKCMTATPLFSGYCIPFLLEKASSPLTKTKVDALDTLSDCANFGHVALVDFLPEIWATFKTEILRSSLFDVISTCLKSLSKIVAAVCDPSVPAKEATKCIEGIIIPALHELRSPECKFAQSYATMLHAAASASDRACNIVCSRILPELNAIFHEETAISKRDGVLIMLTYLLEAIYLVQKRIGSNKNENVDIPKLLEYSGALEIVVGCFAEDNEVLKSSAIKLASRLALFNEAQVERVFEIIRSALTQYNEALQSTAVDAVCWTCARDPEGIKKCVLGHIFDSLISGNGSIDAQQLERYNNLFVTVGQKAPPVVSFLINNATKVVEQYLSKAGDADSSAALLNTMKTVLEGDNWVVDNDVGVYSISTLIQLLVSMSQKGAALPDKVTKVASAVCHKLMRKLAASAQKTVVSRVLSLILGDVTEEMDSSSGRAPMVVDQGNSEYQFVPIFAAIFLGCSRDVINDLPAPVLKRLAEYLSQIIFAFGDATSNTEAFENAVYCIASLLNKTSDADLKNFMVSGIISKIVATATSTDQPLEARLRAVFALSWACKAAAMLGDSKATAQLGQALCDLLRDNSDGEFKVANAAAQGFETVMAEHPDILHKATYARVQVLYKQRFFTIHMPILVSGLSSTTRGGQQAAAAATTTTTSNNNFAQKQQQQASSDEADGPTLLAVAYLVKEVPKAVVVAEAKNLLPLVLRAINIPSQSASLYLAALKTLHTLLVEAKDHVVTYLDSIVQPLLKLTTFKPSMNVRIEAIQCLAEISKYPYVKIFPFKQQVIAGLVPALDDPKRKVRREAVRVRNEWFVISDSNK